MGICPRCPIQHELHGFSWVTAAADPLYDRPRVKVVPEMTWLLSGSDHLGLLSGLEVQTTVLGPAVFDHSNWLL